MFSLIICYVITKYLGTIFSAYCFIFLVLKYRQINVIIPVEQSKLYLTCFAWPFDDLPANNALLFIIIGTI